MSKLLQLTNRLKAQAHADFLTPSQAQALNQIQHAWRFPEIINLHGPSGSGKTFLGWVLARQQQATFYASPRLFLTQAVPTTKVIIDNAPADERQLRILLAELQLQQIKFVLFLSSNPLRIHWPSITLSAPTAADITTVYDNCSKLQFFAPIPPQSSNLWQVIQAVL